MGAVVRDTGVRHPAEFLWDFPTGNSMRAPGVAERRADQEWLRVSRDETPAYLHPAVIIAAGAGYAWLLLVFWVVFFGRGYMELSLVVVTLISGVMLGLMAAEGGGRDAVPWQRQWRSFDEFLAGEVEVWGGRVSGWDAFIQLAGMAWSLAALATAFGIIIEIARP